MASYESFMIVGQYIAGSNSKASMKFQPILTCSHSAKNISRYALLSGLENALGYHASLKFTQYMKPLPT